MNLLAINGSHKRAGGNTQLVLDNLLAGAQHCGAVTETIRLSQCDVRQCNACEACQKRTEYGCIHDGKDDFLGILQKCREADVIVFATPVYVFQMSSKLKTFLERIHGRGKATTMTFSKANLIFHDAERGIFSKPFVSVITASNLEKETTFGTESYFVAFSRFMDAPHVGSIVRTGCGLLFENDGVGLNRRLERILSDTREAGKQLVTEGGISRRLEKRISVSVLPIPGLAFDILKRTRTGREKILAAFNQQRIK